MTGKEKIEELRKTRPEIAITITISRDEDENFVWADAYTEEGYVSYDITVTACKIVNGTLISGEAYLGGAYYKPEEEIGEMHGYLPQKIDEALGELEKKINGWMDLRS
jgi:DNA-binding NarL/FixJ family response regulator